MIYLDHAATTPCAPEVIDAMIPFFRDQFANASSTDHLPGILARRAVDSARESVAALVSARPEDVIFTSGSTEANNLVLSVNFPVFTTPVEHPSILDPFTARRRNEDALLSVDAAGLVVSHDLRQLLVDQPNTLVSVIATNNETGTEQDVAGIAGVVSEAGAMLHLDATQSVGTREIDMRRTAGLAGVSVSAHKIGGPKGVGALVTTSPLRRRIAPILRGGAHERGFRSGTLNVPGIVGFGVAAQLVAKRRTERRERLELLRRRFIEVLAAMIPDQLMETVQSAPVSPHILSLRLIGTNGRALLRAVREQMAFSLGSACATNKTDPSHVLLALGLDRHTIAETIRISFSSDQAINEIEDAAAILAEAARSLTSYSLMA